jgi:hypothetical protein
VLLAAGRSTPGTAYRRASVARSGALVASAADAAYRMRLKSVDTERAQRYET